MSDKNKVSTLGRTGRTLPLLLLFLTVAKDTGKHLVLNTCWAEREKVRNSLIVFLNGMCSVLFYIFKICPKSFCKGKEGKRKKMLHYHSC